MIKNKAELLQIPIVKDGELPAVVKKKETPYDGRKGNLVVKDVYMCVSVSKYRSMQLFQRTQIQQL